MPVKLARQTSSLYIGRLQYLTPRCLSRAAHCIPTSVDAATTAFFDLSFVPSPAVKAQPRPRHHTSRRSTSRFSLTRSYPPPVLAAARAKSTASSSPALVIRASSSAAADTRAQYGYSLQDGMPVASTSAIPYGRIRSTARPSLHTEGNSGRTTGDLSVENGRDSEATQTAKGKERMVERGLELISEEIEIFEHLVDEMIASLSQRADTIEQKDLEVIHAEVIDKFHDAAYLAAGNDDIADLQTQRRLLRPLYLACSRLLAKASQLYVPFSDSDAISFLCATLKEAVPGVRISSGTYNMLLKTYVQQLEVEQSFDTVEQMKKEGHIPSSRTWTLLITLFAHRGEPERAREMFEEMLQEGIEASQHAYTSLLNAYVEAGQWKEAVDIYNHLDSFPDGHPLKPDVFTFTTLLKAYVLMGASLPSVLRLCKTMRRRGMKYRGRTYALMLQSACDAGRMDLAEDIFAELDERDQKSQQPGEQLANVYTFSIMMRGMLRAGNREAAKEYYDEMVRRGIEPSAATWSILIGAYARGNDPTASTIMQKLLDEFLASYTSDTDDPSRPKTARRKRYDTDPGVARRTALQSVYGPIIQAYSQVINSESPPLHQISASEEYLEGEDTLVNTPTTVNPQAIASFQEMLQQPDSKPSMPTYTALLDAFRRVNDLDHVRQVWRVIFDHAVSSTQQLAGLRKAASASDTEVSEESDAVREMDSSRRNILCLPLSIYIDALSANHQHQEVVAAWTEVRMQGFGFDSTNWNVLARALVRAGEIHRAFWTVEKILLQPSIQRAQAADQPQLNLAEEDGGTQLPNPLALAELPENALSLEEELYSQRVETPIRPPNRAHEFQAANKSRARTDQQSKLAAVGQYAITADDMSQVVAPDQHDSTSLNPTEEPADDTNELSQTPLILPHYDPTELFREVSHAREHFQWTAHAATLRALEDALTRLESTASTKQPAEDDPEAERRSIRAAEARKMVDEIRAQFPLTIRAMTTHRQKLDLSRRRIVEE